jgi:hypothetical protein
VGESVLIWGDHFGAADTAERMGYMGKKVYIVTKDSEFAPWMEPCHRDVMMKRFNGRNGEGLKGKTYAHPVTLFCQSTILEIKKDGEVAIMGSDFQETKVKVDNLILAQMAKNDELYETLVEGGMKVARIGDVVNVRNVRGAMTDGANAGLVIEERVTVNANNQLVSNLPAEVAFAGI